MIVADVTYPQTVETRLESRRVALVPPDGRHYGRLREIELAGPMAAGWRYGGGTPSPEDYARLLWAGVLAQYVVVRKDSGNMLGLLTAYDYNQTAQFLHLAGMKFDPEDRSLLFLEGAILFVDHLFEAWPLNKLYMDVPEYNLPQVKSAVGSFFRQEGCLHDHVYAGGRLWSQSILALYRSTWAEQSGALRRFAR